jgi:predicted HNH restriction endonuclease
VEKDRFICEIEVRKSLLAEEITLPIDYQEVFGRSKEGMLERGNSKSVILYLNGMPYNAKISSVKWDKTKRKNDTLQLLYKKDSGLPDALQECFERSNQFINKKIEQGESKPRLPEGEREYLAIYTTEQDDVYELEAITVDDIESLKQALTGKEERIMEAVFNYDMEDPDSTILQKEGIKKIRKLNKKIGDELKKCYDYRCQLCGQRIGEECDAHIVEAHHIDYFVTSLNNDANNQMIVCPNHHRMIHDKNPRFDRKGMQYIYENGYVQKLVLNEHLKR